MHLESVPFATHKSVRLGSRKQLLAISKERDLSQSMCHLLISFKSLDQPSLDKSGVAIAVQEATGGRELYASPVNTDPLK